jgi:hypothetical protein
MGRFSISLTNPAEKLCKAMAIFYGSFGIMLLLAPDFFLGPKSYLCFWTSMDESGKWFARASGAQSLAFIVYGPYYGGLSKDALVKVFLPMNIVAFVLMLQGAFSTASIYSKNSFAKISLWKLILPFAAAILALNLLALKEAAGGSKKKTAPPSPAPSSGRTTTKKAA